MHFIVRSFIFLSAWCLWIGAYCAGAEEPADEVIITDQPDEPSSAPDRRSASSRRREATPAPARAAMPAPAPTATPATVTDAMPAAAPAVMPATAPNRTGQLAEPASLPDESKPFEFDGIQPGVSSAADVRTLWGEPQATREQDGATIHVYAREPFQQVEVTFGKESVLSIVVALKERFSAAEVARQLDVLDFEPVLVLDGAEVCLGQAYPERGVVLRWATIGKAPEDAARQEVSEVAFGCLEPQHFLLRAQARLDRQDGEALADLNRVLQREPALPQALGLKARLLWRVGRRSEAQEAIAGAIEADPNAAEHHLLYGRLLAEAGDSERALVETERAIALSQASAVTRARGLVQWGELLAESAEPDYRRAIESFQQAIKLAEPMIVDPHASVRRAAAEALVDAHLGIANSIAWGRWKMKEMAVAKWLERAEALAQENEVRERLDASLELRVCQAALAACVGAQGKIDPASWAERALNAGRAQLAQVRDPLCRQRLNWQLGLALHDALQTFQVRQEFDSALKYGAAAGACMDEAARGRQLSAADAYMLGRLYYRLGSLYAMRLDQHQMAVAWYDKALPLLDEQAGPPTNLSQHGETLVTAAISYWNERQRDKAVSLTGRGIKLLEQAAEKGEIGKRSLSIPYANLAAMHEQLGDRVQAASYAEQASSLGAETIAGN